jgi:5-methylcytosine-specific restriction protein B
MMKFGAEQNQLWDAFLKAWPIDRLERMAIEEYSKVGDEDSFIRWMEVRLEEMGSIWGGSAFKFGIYNRKSDKEQPGGRGRSYSDEYAWYSKYGKTATEAFERVRTLVVEVARAAQDGNLSRVDDIDLGNAYKWKIAFHYQNRADPVITPIFSRSHIRAFLGHAADKVKSFPELYRMLRERRAGRDVLEFGSDAWRLAVERLNAGILTVEQAEQYLGDRFGVDNDPTEKIASYTTKNEQELALRRGRKEVRLFLQPPLPSFPGVTVEKHYSADDSRSSNLKAKAPSLAVGNSAILVSVVSLNALAALCDAYEGVDKSAMENPSVIPKEPRMTQPLNQILFGPPGTGKTYKAVEKALAVLDPGYLAAHLGDRTALKGKFDEFMSASRVRFITFHQSFSYEDFVEGIRAADSGDVEGNQGLPQYKVEAGVFRRIAEDALLAKRGGGATGVAPGSKVWKISIDGSGPSKIREECFRLNQMRIGWGDVGDLSKPDRPKEQVKSFDEESFTNRNSIRSFAEEVAVGDIVLCLKSQTSIQAIGIVNGDYKFDPSNSGLWRAFSHVRPVKWLKTDLDVDVLKANGGVRLTLKTLYPLWRIDPADALSLADIKLASASNEPAPYVLIIDEINRGNVSRIFGELITLLEDSKRDGQSEALPVILPYSRKEFRVPDNLYIIGTMNTADRSLTGLDVALRRRFRFEEVPPDETELADIVVDGVSIEDVLSSINDRIEILLDRDHRVGHTYFLPLKDDTTLTRLAAIFEREILPLLQEYFYGDWERIHWVLNDHCKPEAVRFILRPPISAVELFGDDVAEKLDDRRWTINRSAFNNIESYRSIVAVAKN